MIQVKNLATQERDKYAQMWSFEDYGKRSPGFDGVERFMEVLEPRPGSTLIDIGCGAGVAGLEFAKRGLNVSYIDITDAAIESPEVRSRFIEAPIWTDWWVYGQRMAPWDYGYCADVLEHVPTELTMLCVDKIVSCCKVSWLQIALVPDQFGALIGQPLHLTVQPFRWWLERLSTIADVREARDLCGCGLYVVTR